VGSEILHERWMCSDKRGELIFSGKGGDTPIKEEN
jgi:hypothetical protein